MLKKDFPKIEVVAYGNDRTFFLVDNVQLSMAYFKGAKDMTCCCKHCSINSIKNPTCYRKKALKKFFEVMKDRV